jgi:hypothetical protein
MEAEVQQDDVNFEIERLLASAEDAMTDEMVSRLSGTVSQSLDLLDRINRSGIDRALPTIAQLVENGDLERVIGIARLIGSTEDAMTDEMVGRLSGTVSQSLDLLDRINRSGIDRALPTIAQLVENGDLERLAGIARLIGSTEDAMTDEMVGRLSGTVSHGLDLLDRINRSGIDRALPTIAQLVENGDLDRLMGIARLIGSVEDSLSDDIVNRLALIVTGLAALVDKLTRNEGFQRLVDLLGQEEVQDSLVDLLGAASVAKSEAASLPPAKGGFGGMWKIATDPATQDALRFVTLMTRQLNKR